MKIAVIGAYGNGKSTLSESLSAELGVPRVHATPMALQEGALRTSLEECTDLELVQLVARRLVERVGAEAAAGDGFVSDGSVLHEFVYAATRFRHGLHPRSVDAEARPELPREAEIIERVSVEAGRYAAQTYHAFVHVPNERPLADEPPPISEAFRELLDSRMLSVAGNLGVPVIRVKGDRSQRLAMAVRQLGETAGAEAGT
ncbi:AAA family ATPase [Amycolatopsis australiensis]|uniref:AAA domain-containing protein n=1 Tax=Amycolatopsis australiensis TaxID=546364 RepID=A0A1K1S2M7_9PSEU|nr:AAA family ATPase [Amycolatopsis australiensis]SFW78664.1 AAA domain-containing protein [Amycolatopsis australiensis]